MNTALISYGGVVHFTFLQHNHYLVSFRLAGIPFNVDILKIYLVFFVVMITDINFKVKDQLDKELSCIKETQLQAISDYSGHIESLYREIRGFKHDYTNILTSLSEAIEQKDLKMIKKIYDATLLHSDKQFYTSKYDIANLSMLNNDAMKSVIYTKLNQAQHMGIKIDIEIVEPIGMPNMDLIDIITILTTFLDNAIEGAEVSKNPQLLLAYFKEADKHILIIENSIDVRKLSTQAIFEYGYSTKGDGRGVGLSNVREILAKYAQVTLLTSSQQYQFRQELHIYS